MVTGINNESIRNSNIDMLLLYDLFFISIAHRGTTLTLLLVLIVTIMISDRWLIQTLVLPK